MSSPIYKLFSTPIPVLGDAFNAKFKYNYCNSVKQARLGTQSNLIAHLKTKSHSQSYGEYLGQQKIFEELSHSRTSSGSAKKRARRSLSCSDNQSLETVGIVSVKYPKNSQTQKLHSDALTQMLIKCMLPVSIVENPSFREYLSIVDPLFNVPCGNTIKDTSLPNIRAFVKETIKSALNRYLKLNKILIT
jgi:hypothetical protein